jgi:hypothetical protein
VVYYWNRQLREKDPEHRYLNLQAVQKRSSWSEHSEAVVKGILYTCFCWKNPVRAEWYNMGWSCRYIYDCPKVPCRVCRNWPLDYCHWRRYRQYWDTHECWSAPFAMDQIQSSFAIFSLGHSSLVYHGKLIVIGGYNASKSMYSQTHILVY